MSGFSHGGFMTANLFSMFNDNIEGAAINAGFGPCATAGLSCEVRSDPRPFNTSGIKGKPVFVYSGVNDSVVYHNMTTATADFFESLGANVSRRYIHDFFHVLPNSVQGSDQFNPPSSCARKNAVDMGNQNCGYNLAFEVLQHLYGADFIKDPNYQESGNLYSID